MAIDAQLFLQRLSTKILSSEKVDMDQDLRMIQAWDSLSAVSFLAMVDVEFGSTINPLELKGAQTVRDLYELACEGADG